MAFIIEDYGGCAVNTRYIRRIYAECNKKTFGSAEIYGELDDGTYAHFAIFEGANEEENRAAGHAYLKKLIDRINSVKE